MSNVRYPSPSHQPAGRRLVSRAIGGLTPTVTNDVTVQLTGVSATASIGSLGVAISIAGNVLVLRKGAR